METPMEFCVSQRHESSSRSIRRTGWCIALLVIGLFAACFVVKWAGLLPSPISE